MSKIQLRKRTKFLEILGKDMCATGGQTWDSKMTSKISIDMAASFYFFSSFLAKSISFYFRNQIYTALGFQKYSHCNKVLYISPWTIPFYTSDVSLLTKKSLIFAIFYKGESGVLLKYDPAGSRFKAFYIGVLLATSYFSCNFLRIPTSRLEILCSIKSRICAPCREL